MKWNAGVLGHLFALWRLIDYVKSASIMTRAMYSSSSDLRRESWFKDIEMKWNAGVLGHCLHYEGWLLLLAMWYVCKMQLAYWLAAIGNMLSSICNRRSCIWSWLVIEMKWNAGVLGHLFALWLVIEMEMWYECVKSARYDWLAIERVQ